MASDVAAMIAASCAIGSQRSLAKLTFVPQSLVNARTGAEVGQTLCPAGKKNKTDLR
jgi:hypothetical protein